MLAVYSYNLHFSYINNVEHLFFCGHGSSIFLFLSICIICLFFYQVVRLYLLTLLICKCSYLSQISKMDFIYQISFRLTENLSESILNSQIPLSPTPSTTASPIIKIMHHSVTFVSGNDSTQTHIPKSKVTIRVHSWYYIFHGFNV